MPVCEIISVGTELLLGQILNTNSHYLAQELAGLGISCFYQTTVGDNKTRLISSIRTALDRSDILLITGGLGPTADDLTTECLAEALKVELFFDESVLERIAEFFRQRGHAMPLTNRKQAMRPCGSDLLHNPRGTAPGCIWSIKDPQILKRAGLANIEQQRFIMTFPGVPSEMKTMWKETAADYLQKKFGDQVLWSCELKHYGIGESALAEKYAHLLEQSNPTVAPYAGQGECRLRVTAKANTVDEAKAIATPVISEILRDSGSLCYGIDTDTLESVVGKALTEANLVLATAESCTGGLVSKRLTDIAGSSSFTKLNVVTYANEAKMTLLHVPEEILETDGAVSETCAKAMASGIRKLAGADIGLSTTGVAGPSGGTREKPVGLVYLGLDYMGQVSARRLTLPSQLPRDEIRFRTASEALNMVRLSLKK